MVSLVIPWQRRRCEPYGLLAGLATVPVVVILLARQAAAEPQNLVWLTGIVVSTALVLAATLANLERMVLGLEELWPVVAVFSAFGAKTVVASAAADQPSTTWLLLTDVGLLCSVLLLVRLTSSRRFRPPPMALGAALGVGAATFLVAPPVELAEWSTLTRSLLAATVLAGYVLASCLVRRHWPWSMHSRTAITLALLALGVAHTLQGFGASATWAGLAGAAANLLAATLFGITLYSAVNGDLFADRGRFTALREQLLADQEAAQRDRAERHAMRNMVAGISMASELLEDDGLEEPTRRRLEHTIHVEAVQLCQLLDRNRPAPVASSSVPPTTGSLGMPHSSAPAGSPTDTGDRCPQEPPVTTIAS